MAELAQVGPATGAHGQDRQAGRGRPTLGQRVQLGDGVRSQPQPPGPDGGGGLLAREGQVGGPDELEPALQAQPLQPQVRHRP